MYPLPQQHSILQIILVILVLNLSYQNFIIGDNVINIEYYAYNVSFMLAAIYFENNSGNVTFTSNL